MLRGRAGKKITSRAKLCSSSDSFKENLRVKSGVTRLQGPRTRACLDSTTPRYTTRKHSTRRGHSSTHNGVYVAVSHQKERKMNANASTTVLEPAALAVGTQHSTGFAPAIAHKQESKRPEWRSENESVSNLRFCSPRTTLSHSNKVLPREYLNGIGRNAEGPRSVGKRSDARARHAFSLRSQRREDRLPIAR